MAGGLTELADRKIVIERRATHERFTYVVSNDGSAALDQKVVVYPGDTVLVAKVGVVYVLGDVGRPGGFPMATNDSTISVLQAVALAGGTPPTAVPSHARLIRKTPQGYAETHLPLSDMQKGKVADMPMFANDIVYVPFSYAKSMVVNASSIIAVAGSAAVYHF
jgi:polysaccharide export outer membrane protein